MGGGTGGPSPASATSRSISFFCPAPTSTSHVAPGFTSRVGSSTAWQVVESFGQLSKRWEEYPQVRAAQSAVTSRNFQQLLAEHEVPREFDLLSIDIDGNDYWVWNSLIDWRPRVVVIEYNAFHLPPKKWVMQENDNHRWNGTTYFGAAFTSLRNLGRAKGYTVVGTDPRGVNMFFVRTDCLPSDKFLDPELQYFFQPFGYHSPPAGEGSFVEC